MFSIVFNNIECLNSINIGNGVIDTKSYFSNLNNLIKIMCRHDDSTCDLYNPAMNVNVNNGFVNNIRVRLDASLFKSNLKMILESHNVNYENIIFNKTFYNDKYEDKKDLDIFTFSKTTGKNDNFNWLIVLGYSALFLVSFCIICTLIKCCLKNRIKEDLTSNTHLSSSELVLSSIDSLQTKTTVPLKQKSYAQKIPDVERIKTRAQMHLPSEYDYEYPNPPNALVQLSSNPPLPPANQAQRKQLMMPMNDNLIYESPYIHMEDLLPIPALSQKNLYEQPFPINTSPKSLAKNKTILTSTPISSDTSHTENIEELKKLIEELDQPHKSFKIKTDNKMIKPQIQSPTLPRRKPSRGVTFSPILSTIPSPCLYKATNTIGPNDDHTFDDKMSTHTEKIKQSPDILFCQLER